MCQGFGLAVTKDGRYLWIEPDKDGDVSHSTILWRAGIKYNTSAHMRSFVLVEFPGWTPDSFRFDEKDTLPGWVDEVAVQDKCTQIMLRVKTHWKEYKRIEQPAWEAMIKSIKSISGYVGE